MSSLQDCKFYTNSSNLWLNKWSRKATLVHLTANIFSSHLTFLTSDPGGRLLGITPKHTVNKIPQWWEIHYFINPSAHASTHLFSSGETLRLELNLHLLLKTSWVILKGSKVENLCCTWPSLLSPILFYSVSDLALSSISTIGIHLCPCFCPSHFFWNTHSSFVHPCLTLKSAQNFAF